MNTTAGSSGFSHTEQNNPLLLRTSYYIPIPENQQELDTLPLEFRSFMLSFHFLSCITGIFGNVLTILAVSLSKKLQTVNNFFVAHLAAVDLLIAGVVVPININATLFGDGRISHCVVFGPMIVSVMVLSLLSMANIALNRYFMVCRPPQVYAEVYSKKNIAIIVLISYVYTFVLLLPPFFGFGRWAEHVKFKTCLFTAYDLNSYKYGVGVLCTLAFIPPASICLFSYYSIIKKFRESRAKFSKVTPQVKISMDDSDETAEVAEEEGTTKSSRNYSHATTTTTATTTQSQKTNDMRNNTTKKASSKTFKTILGMILVFVIFVLCWTPVIIVFISDFYGTWSAQLYVPMLSIAWLNSSINIVLYAALNVKFRQAYRQLITFKWKQLRNIT